MFISLFFLKITTDDYENYQGRTKPTRGAQLFRTPPKSKGFEFHVLAHRSITGVDLPRSKEVVVGACQMNGGIDQARNRRKRPNSLHSSLPPNGGENKVSITCKCGPKTVRALTLRSAASVASKSSLARAFNIRSRCC